MLTAERIETFKQMLINNQSPTSPEDISDFEIVKAMVLGQAMTSTAVPTPAPATVPATVPAPTALTPAPAAAPAVPLPTPTNGNSFTMEDAMKASMAVDKYLKVKNGVTYVNNDVVSNDPIYVKINLDSVVVKQSIKAGNPVKYMSTLDGRTCLQGGSWIDAVADMQKIDPKARPYFCVDLALQLVKDVKAFDGSIIAASGEVLGHTTATTNWKDWSRFYAALPTHTGEIYARLTRQDVKKDNNQWALIEFQYVTDEQAKQLGLA